MTKHRILVITLHYNSRKILGELLDQHMRSLLETDYDDFHILFVDNNSQDDTLKYVMSRYGHHKIIHFLRLDKDCSFAEANNIAFNYALHKLKLDFDIVVFLNNDTIVDKYWLRYIDECFRDPKVGLCGCTIKNMDNTLQYLGGYMGFFGHTLAIGGGELTQMVSKLLKALSFRPLEVLWVSGACLAIRAHLFNQVGGFNTVFRFGFEELSIAVPVVNLGYKVVVHPCCIVLHKGGGTVKKVSSRRRRLLQAMSSASPLLFALLYLPRPKMIMGKMFSELLRSLMLNNPYLLTYLFFITRKARMLINIRRRTPKVPEKYLLKTPIFMSTSTYNAFAIEKLIEINKLSREVVSHETCR
jgi:hypothetical protein